jgi:DNA-dependent protein kinase catalytic subunit
MVLSTAELSNIINNRSSLELEMDILNKHPCMTPILRMIIYLHIEITPPVSPNGNMPLWMTELLKSFVSAGNNINVRLLISKIIVNWPAAFEKYAKFWIQPIMKLVMEGETFGEPMNYHVQVGNIDAADNLSNIKFIQIVLIRICVLS